MTRRVDRGLAVETRGLTMRFGGVTALNNVDFILRARELRCIIGPNGAGKSTFFKCLSGQLRPSAGRIYIGGEETQGRPPHAIARLGVGIKTQVPSVMNGLSVHENLWLAARRGHGGRRAAHIVDNILGRLDLGAESKATVDTLAHGRRQLVELGIVLAGDPWLILLDEPAAGLTADEIDRMIDILRDINREAALIIVEHDMHFVRRIAERVTVFHQGDVLIDADVDAVMSDQAVRDVYLGRDAA
ncbi:MAG: ATP-binding cassette domain-containing protein [Pseudomonadota bacterium]